jgi:hypothetical protein
MAKMKNSELGRILRMGRAALRRLCAVRSRLSSKQNIRAKGPKSVKKRLMATPGMSFASEKGLKGV